MPPVQLHPPEPRRAGDPQLLPRLVLPHAPGDNGASTSYVLDFIHSSIYGLSPVSLPAPSYCVVVAVLVVKGDRQGNETINPLNPLTTRSYRWFEVRVPFSPSCTCTSITLGGSLSGSAHSGSSTRYTTS